MKLFGNGAAGNKALAELIRTGLIKIDECVMVNSTDKDVPEEFKETFINIGQGKGGCGKETQLAYELTLESLNGGDLGKAIEFLINDNDEEIGIITSSEGGTGCGSTPILAEYLDRELDLIVHAFIFTGFEDDPRGLANTVNLFKEISDRVVVHVIRNSTFLKEAKGSYTVAEQLANKELAKMYRIITGKTIKDSFQNMDDTDLFKTINYPGYSIVGSVDLDRTVNDEDGINADLKKYISNLHTFKGENQKVKMRGVILSLADAEIAIDRKFPLLTEAFGQPFDSFVHIQEVPEDEQNITFILSGMDMPQAEIKSIYSRYQNEMNKVKKGADSFFERRSELSTNTDDFDMMSTRGRRNTKRAGASFFDHHKKDQVVEKNDNKKVVEIPKAIMEKM